MTLDMRAEASTMPKMTVASSRQLARLRWAMIRRSEAKLFMEQRTAYRRGPR